ncbi:hypothetical protein OR16_35727 [Cupriavidus basilensis OR16]|uniref:Type 1 fimbrial protein n=1 Tax=Cupriavidus basilensis OR16 TaxID=1127483 RepID=H1SFM0_9BURK|nr:hypothetical protein [Cupriavidus basilensis]EHP38592.1 hypothetical protein OR16_35727 [Cupriavidus basilensis OR16]
MSTFARTGRCAAQDLAKRLPLVLASALLSVPAWAADGIIAFRGAIVAPSCATQMSASGSPSVSCPASGNLSAEFAVLPPVPGKVAMLKTARVSVEAVQFVKGSGPSSRQQGIVVVTEYY